jgi:uncharacterized membrane protein
MAEPDWTKGIDSSTVCNFFYIFFIAYGVLGALVIVGFLGMALTIKVPKGMLLWNGFLALIPLAIATTQFLFFYLICERGLKPGSAVARVVDEAFQNMRR